MIRSYATVAVLAFGVSLAVGLTAAFIKAVAKAVFL